MATLKRTSLCGFTCKKNTCEIKEFWPLTSQPANCIRFYWCFIKWLNGPLLYKHNMVGPQKPLWACLGMPDHTHQNLHDQFITLRDLKLHVQNQLDTSFSFWDLKVLIASLGMPDPTHEKLHYQFVALIDMYLHPKNQLYSSNNFSDINPSCPVHFKKL